jgi:hypothetical protein
VHRNRRLNKSVASSRFHSGGVCSPSMPQKDHAWRAWCSCCIIALVYSWYRSRWLYSSSSPQMPRILRHPRCQAALRKGDVLCNCAILCKNVTTSESLELYQVALGKGGFRLAVGGREAGVGIPTADVGSVGHISDGTSAKGGCGAVAEASGLVIWRVGGRVSRAFSGSGHFGRSARTWLYSSPKP